MPIKGGNSSCYSLGALPLVSSFKPFDSSHSLTKPHFYGFLLFLFFFFHSFLFFTSISGLSNFFLSRLFPEHSSFSSVFRAFLFQHFCFILSFHFSSLFLLFYHFPAFSYINFLSFSLPFSLPFSFPAPISISFSSYCSRSLTFLLFSPFRLFFLSSFPFPPCLVGSFYRVSLSPSRRFSFLLHRLKSDETDFFNDISGIIGQLDSVISHLDVADPER